MVKYFAGLSGINTTYISIVMFIASGLILKKAARPCLA
jgi:hypothetical protein